MGLRILQIFTSREGQTAKIAGCMAAELQQLGHYVETIQLQGALPKILDLRTFDWVFIGGSIHYGKHESFLAEFIRQHLQQLKCTNTLFFSVNLTARKANKKTVDNNPYVQKFLNQLGWQPTQAKVFAGALKYSQYRFLDKHMIRFIMWITGGSTDLSKDLEFTDWDDLKAFTLQLVAPLEAK